MPEATTDGGHRRYTERQIIEFKKKQMGVQQILIPDLKPKNGSTWFNQQCWRDEYTIIKKQHSTSTKEQKTRSEQVGDAVDALEHGNRPEAVVDSYGKDVYREAVTIVQHRKDQPCPK